MFEEYTEEYFLNKAREMGEKLGVDTRQGSVYMDAAAGHCIRIAKFYEDLRSMHNMMFIDTCQAEALDAKALERNVKRRAPTSSYYRVTVDGVPKSSLVGKRFIAEGFYFELVHYNGEYVLKSEIPGSDSNGILSGVPVVPLQNINALKSVILGEIFAMGSNKESDEDLRERLKQAIIEPAQNGNAKQYKKWCEEYPGVGRAITRSLALGDNTIKIVLISTEGRAPDRALIKTIQDDIDPGSMGLGEGKALIGCKATEEMVDISMSIVLESGYDRDNVISNIKKSIISYLRELALKTRDAESIVVQYAKMMGLLASTEGIKDVSNLLIGKASTNFNIGMDSIPILGEVTVK